MFAECVLHIHTTCYLLLPVWGPNQHLGEGQLWKMDEFVCGKPERGEKPWEEQEMSSEKRFEKKAAWVHTDDSCLSRDAIGRGDKDAAKPYANPTEGRAKTSF